VHTSRQTQKQMNLRSKKDHMPLLMVLQYFDLIYKKKDN
jgi:hypothetical protein